MGTPPRPIVSPEGLRGYGMSKLSLTLFLGFFVAIAVSYALIQNQRETARRSEELVMDALKIIRECSDISKDSGATDFEHAFRFQQHVIDAKKRLTPWLNENHRDWKKTISALEEMLGHFDTASELYVKLNKEPPRTKKDADEDLALYVVKLEVARKKSVDVAVGVRELIKTLTSDSKKRILNRVNLSWGNEIKKYRSQEHEPNAQLSFELASILLIKHALEKEE